MRITLSVSWIPLKKQSQQDKGDNPYCALGSFVYRRDKRKKEEEGFFYVSVSTRFYRYGYKRSHCPLSGVLRTQILRFSSAENPELSKVLSFKPGVGQNIALRASSAGRKISLPIFAFLVQSTSAPLSKTSLYFLPVSGVANAIFPVSVLARGIK